MTTNSKPYELKKVATKWLCVKGQIRQGWKDDDVQRLAASLVKDGQLQAIGVLKDGTVLWGHRRVAAALLAGIEFLDAKVFDEAPTESERILLQRAENLHEALAEADLLGAIEEYVALHPEFTNQQIAVDFSLDPSEVTRLRAIGRATAGVQEAFRAGRIGRSVAYSLTKLPEADQAAALVEALAGATRDQIEAKRKAPKPAASGVRLDRVRMTLPNGIGLVMTGAKLGMAEVVENLADLLKEARKAAETYDVKTWEKMLRDRSKSGGA